MNIYHYFVNLSKLRCKITRDFRLPPPCKWDLPFSA